MLSILTVKFDSKPKEKFEKLSEIEEFFTHKYIKISRNFPGNRKNSRESTGMKFFGKFPGIPGYVAALVSTI